MSAPSAPPTQPSLPDTVAKLESFLHTHADPAPAAHPPVSLELQRKTHIKYFQRCLKMLPSSVSSLDPNRVTLVFFSVSALDLLAALPPPEERVHIIDWIYNLQTVEAAEGAGPTAGFRAAPELGLPFDPSSRPSAHPLDFSHVTMTYTAIAVLAILGDDFSRLRRKEIALALRHHQLPDGSMCSTVERAECDLRFLYCATCVAHMLGDWEGIDVEGAAGHVLRCMTYEGAFGQHPGLEAHAGSTFLALASLGLMNKLSLITEEQRTRLVQWLVQRQQSGFHGRPGKDDDTCYSFWVGASLAILGAIDLIDHATHRAFLSCTQHPIMGGFSKLPDTHPDPLHSYLGLAGLAIDGLDGLPPLHPALNITMRAAAALPCHSSLQ